MRKWLAACLLLLCAGASAEEIALPAGLKTIGPRAFAGNGSAVSVRMPEQAVNVAAGAFADCLSLEEVQFPGGMGTVEAGAFSGSPVRTLRVEKGAVTCAAGALPAATLEEAVFGGEVTRIGADAFSGSENLRRLVFSGRASIDEGAFSDCPEGTVVVAPYDADAVRLIDGKHFIGAACRALLIGQNYEGTKNVLNGCAEDAASFGAMLADSGQGFLTQDTMPTVRADRRLSKAQVMEAIRTAYVGADETSVSVFYFSGHGNKSDTSLVVWGATGVSYQGITPAELRVALDEIPGMKIVVIDACYSGGFAGRSAAASVQDEEDARAFAEGFLSAFTATGRSPGNLVGEGYHVLVSCTRAEESVSVNYGTGEEPLFAGLFTKVFLEAFGWDRLTGEWMPGSADMPGDEDGSGCVTLAEAYRYATRMIAAYKETHPAIAQTTTFASLSRGDVVLFGRRIPAAEGGEGDGD